MSQQEDLPNDRIELARAMNRAKRTKNSELYERLAARKRELDAIEWQEMLPRFPELAPFQSLVEACIQTAARLGVPFPDLSHPTMRTNDGIFMLGIADDTRTVQAWLREDLENERGHYFVQIFDYGPGFEAGRCYKGTTLSLEEITLLISRWFIDRLSIEELHAQLPWIASKPFQLQGPRITFE